MFGAAMTSGRPSQAFLNCWPVLLQSAASSITISSGHCGVGVHSRGSQTQPPVVESYIRRPPRIVSRRSDFLRRSVIDVTEEARATSVPLLRDDFRETLHACGRGAYGPRNTLRRT